MQRMMNLPEQADQRRWLRRDLTPAEASLWRMLKNRHLENLKFRRQHSVGPYVLDFYCPQLRLGIELDGQSHEGQGYKDEQRSAYLWQKKKITVLRYENRVVFEQPEVIFADIQRHTEGRLHSSESGASP